MSRKRIINNLGVSIKRVVRIFLPLLGILFFVSTGCLSAPSGNITVTVTVKPQINLHDGETINVIPSPTQQSDGSGKINITFRIKHSGGLPCDVVNGSFQYRINGGVWQNINDSDIVGQRTNLASSSGMDGPLHTLVWDNSKEVIDDLYSQNVQFRFKVSDGVFTSEYGTSPLGFNIDNLDPQGLNNLQLLARRSRIQCNWTAVTTEHSWSLGAHYEIWYGTNQAEVESRSGTAQEWDNNDDPNLSLMTTNQTTITGLLPQTTYFLKIWAVDDFGNEVSLPTQQIATLGDGTITISAGEKNPSNGYAHYRGQTVPMVQLKLVTGPQEYLRITSIKFNASGTGDDLNHILAGGVKLYRDVNGNGVVDGQDLFIASSSYNADNGEVTFAPLSEILPWDTTQYWLVTHDYAGLEESKLKTFQTIFTQATDIVVSGEESGNNITPQGTFPIRGGVITLVEAGEIVVSMGENTSPTEEIMNNVKSKQMIQIKLTEVSGYENVRIVSVSFTAQGTGNDKEDVYNAKLFVDENANGVYDSSDTHLGTRTFSADDGMITFTLISNYQVPKGGTKYLILTYDFNGTASAGETFISEVLVPGDIQFKGITSGANIIPRSDNFPFIGNTKTIVTGQLQVEAGPANPGDTNIVNNALGVSVLQIKLSETTGLENINVSSFTFTAQGTGDESQDLSSVKFFYDANSNGVYDSGVDTHLGTKSFSVDNGTITFSFLSPQTIPKGSYKNYLLTYDFNGKASIGETFMCGVNLATDIVAKGAISNKSLLPQGTFPIMGGVMTIQATSSGELYMYKGINSPSDGNVRNSSSNVAMLQLKLEASSQENIEVSAVNFTLVYSPTAQP
ncbi:MAG: hypothetical protein NC822_07390, partial [Candidatus Omnitrophica bacterium]|nr:hypothetical protein [Candidatus Omnitrophota bacterium]